MESQGSPYRGDSQSNKPGINFDPKYDNENRRGNLTTQTLGWRRERVKVKDQDQPRRRKRAIVFDAFREMAGVDPKELKNKDIEPEPKSQSRSRLAKPIAKESRTKQRESSKAPSKSKALTDRPPRLSFEEDDPEPDRLDRTTRNEPDLNDSWFRSVPLNPTKPPLPSQTPQDSEDDFESESDDVSVGGQDISTLAPSHLIPSSAKDREFDAVKYNEEELNNVLETIKSALKNDPLAAPITSLKQAKSLETINFAASYIASVVGTQNLQLEELRGKLRILENEKNATESQRIQLAAELSGSKQSYKHLESEKRRFEQALENARQEREEKERIFTRDHHEDQRSLQKSQNEVQRLSMELERLKGEKRAMKTHYDKEMVSLTSRHTNELEQLRTDHAREIKDEKDASKTREEELKRTHERALQRKESLHQAKVEQLTSLKEELTGELLKRDHFNSLKDRDIQLRFNALVDKVDLLARTEWSERAARSWPIKPWLLQSATNKREAKQYVLQDTMWRTLYIRIFCSPFRMLGEEGRVLEQQWLISSGIRNNSFSSNNFFFEYPKASKATESWRYEKLRSIGETILKPQSSTHELDPSYKIQQSYSAWLSATQNEIYEAIANVATPEESRLTISGCKEIAEDAARMWVDFGKERYRIIMAMPVDVNHGTASDNDFPELVIEPELRRFGNGKGEDLHREHLVSEGGKTHHVQRY